MIKLLQIVQDCIWKIIQFFCLLVTPCSLLLYQQFALCLKLICSASVEVWVQAAGDDPLTPTLVTLHQLLSAPARH